MTAPDNVAELLTRRIVGWAAVDTLNRAGMAAAVASLTSGSFLLCGTGHLDDGLAVFFEVEPGRRRVGYRTGGRHRPMDGYIKVEDLIGRVTSRMTTGDADRLKALVDERNDALHRAYPPVYYRPESERGAEEREAIRRGVADQVAAERSLNDLIRDVYDRLPSGQLDLFGGAA